MATGCDRPALQLQFNVPDGYVGILKIRSHHREGVALRPTNGVIDIHFTTNGTCDIQGELRTLQWHQICARYATRGSVQWIQFPDQTPQDAVGLRSLGLKDNVEDWYVIGTMQNVRAGMDQKYGFHVPKK